MAAAPIQLTALIVDDESLARQELQYLLENAGGVQVLAQGSNGIEAVELIRRHRPDVVFLDVQMPALDGFAVLKKVMTLDRKAALPDVVFATAFDRYAVRAFEVNAVDYLLKPFDPKRLVQTLDKLRSRRSPQAAGDSAHAAPAESTSTEAKLNELLRMMEEARQPAAAPRSGKVVIRSGGRLMLIDQREICFAAIADGTIHVVTRAMDGEGMFRTLEEFFDELNPEHFWRAHRGFVVNIQHIREVVPWFKGSYQLRMDDRKATEIPVSRTQTRRLRELFKL